MKMRFPAAMAALASVTGLLAGAAFVGTPLHAQSAGGSDLKVQVFDQRGAPVRDAVVEIHPAGGTSGPIRFPWRMAMAQKDQQFIPGTLIVAKGSTVAFPNLDRVRHSVYSFSKPARFEIDLYGRDQTRTQGFPIAGSVALGCNIHDAMRGYIRVTETPYAAKTDGNGIIRLKNTPVGEARLTVWHPQLRNAGNEFSGPVQISAGGDAKSVRIKLR